MTTGLLDGRVAIVTGASRSIGLAVARRMAENGASAMLVDIDQAGVEDAANAIRDAGIERCSVCG